MSFLDEFLKLYLICQDLIVTNAGSIKSLSLCPSFGLGYYSDPLTLFKSDGNLAETATLATHSAAVSLMSNVIVKGASTHISSETLRGDLSNKLHRIKHKKPTSKQELGQYLAGLFEGDGHISKIPQVVTVFHEKDTQSAITLCSTFGHGTVNPVQGKKAVTWVISNKPGVF
jgi:hypothetical protein